LGIIFQIKVNKLTLIKIIFQDIYMVYAVVLAGGHGSRLNSDVPKQLLKLGDRLVIQWSVDVFIKSPSIDGVLIVCEKAVMDKIKNLFPADEYPDIIAYVNGGKERSDSSFNALKAHSFRDDDIVLFHDAARPFVTERIINEVVSQVKHTGAAGTYIPATDTVTVINGGIVQHIPERAELYYAQTPQGFRFEIINSAHDNSHQGSVTDDVALVMNKGKNVSMVSGEPYNFKITSDFDYKVAQFLAEKGLYD
jgi:2-C-methyl-D-erythritol 4-phosphate cytidylyltransferase